MPLPTRNSVPECDCICAGAIEATGALIGGGNAGPAVLARADPAAAVPGIDRDCLRSNSPVDRLVNSGRKIRALLSSLLC